MSDTMGTQFRFEDLVTFLDDRKINHLTCESEKQVLAGLPGEIGPIHMIGQIDEERDVLLLTFMMPLTVPEHRRLAMADAVARVNMGLILGAFHLNLDDGRLLFHVGIPIEGAMLSFAQLNDCLGVAVASSQRNLPKFLDVMFKDAAPEEVFAVQTKTDES